MPISTKLYEGVVSTDATTPNFFSLHYPLLLDNTTSRHTLLLIKSPSILSS